MTKHTAGPSAGRRQTPGISRAAVRVTPAGPVSRQTQPGLRRDQA